MTAAEQQDEYADIRDAVAKLCAQFPGEYWRKLDREMAYPSAFVDALTQAGYLSVLIPEEYGGAGLKLSAAAAILEEIQRAGCNGGGCHAQMYTMGTLLLCKARGQRQLYRQRPEDLDQPRRIFRPDDLAGAHHAKRAIQKAHRRPVGFHRRYEGCEE
jgi:alkylation response protein AidB-like acyl-CoA dehydrogenase